MQCLLLHAENGCKRLFSPFRVQNVLKRAVSLFWVQKAEKGVFPLFGSKTCSRVEFRCLGSKTCSRVEFRCFGVQNVLKSGVSLFCGPKGAQQVSFALLGSEHSILQIWDSKTFRPLFHLFLRLWGLYLAVWSENDPFGLISH